MRLNPSSSSFPVLILFICGLFSNVVQGESGGGSETFLSEADFKNPPRLQNLEPTGIG